MRWLFYGPLFIVALAACSAGRFVPLAPFGGASGTPGIAGHHLHLIAFFQFPGKKLGEQPVPGLIGDTSDNLYGVTEAGGNASCSLRKLHGCGIVYKLTHVSGLQYTESVVHAFHRADGAFPDSPLVGGNGFFYGTTSHGGARDAGTVYQVNVATGNVRTLYAFKAGKDGASPIGRLYVDAKGNLFGTTAFGGGGSCTGGCGTVFELHRSGARFSERILYRFKGGADGWEPWAGVSFFAGSFYGSTIYGGTGSCSHGCGTVFALAASGRTAKTTLHSFAGAAEGAYVRSPLYVDTSGNLYGETQNGGDDACEIQGADEAGCGAIFKLARTKSGWKTATLYRFSGGEDGAQPYTGLTAFKGLLYGTTSYGGRGTCTTAASGCGIAFSIEGKKFTLVANFLGKKGTAANPAIFLCAITNELNGTTSSGGRYGYGMLFKIAQ